ncbi:BTAD domain-containing putative transcriptional regulator [Herbidospora yilanensis]|uniref:BTAD domain-containing putative transcriptional regulator n=1 Tax=Herbidospora yilanensis TaxID=354426 RepID=UPI0007808B4F|nr:BTAD domain-containing putative transcriptional regulator [Herbidospora yilanensis]
MTVRVRVLGPLQADVDGRSVLLGGPRQRAVLALLVASRGDVVSVDRMIEDLWRGEPPAKAIASLQSYVANLRRLLEPGRPPRAPASVLVSAAPGYAVRLDADAVDAWRFERSAAEARDLSARDPAAARTLLSDALGVWQGAAFAEFADEDWAVAEAARLTEVRLVAQELLVETTLRSAPPADAVPAAEMLTRREPLREEGWRLLALALWGSGRQADALAALRRARTTLADELGLDPGPALTDLEDAVLAQRLDLLHAATRAPGPAGHTPVTVAAPRAAENWTDPAGPLFVGRDLELAEISDAAARAAAGDAGVVLISGEPGAGKSTLMARIADDLDPATWLVATGRCPETEGAPPAWAWIEALSPLTRIAPLNEHAEALAPLLGDARPPSDDGATGRFRMHRAACAWLRTLSTTSGRALAIVLDDLHRADAETLGLLVAVAEELTAARVLLVAAYRPSDVTDAQEDALAALAARSPTRLHLDGLSEGDVERLVTSVCGREVEAGTVAWIAERTGGNPFYVRESARLLASEGSLAGVARSVPEGVRDVLRRRLARLPAPAVTVLRLAAAVGREAEVEVLVGAADADEDGVLDALEAGVLTGLLTEPSPGRVRFTHALVRDTLYHDLSQVRLTRMHARIADALAALHPDDHTALAHHYARAGTSATAERAVAHSVKAAELATRRYAYDTATELYEQALVAFDRLPAQAMADRDAARVELLAALVRAQVLDGAVAHARVTRQKAVEIAQAAGRDDLLIAAFSCWTEATPWLIRPYSYVDERTVGLITRLLKRADLDPVVRCRLLEMIVSELENEGDPRSAAAAAELEELAATLGDPAMTALALTVRIKEIPFELEPRRVLDLSVRLVDLATRHDHLLAYRWYGEFVATRACWVLGDLPGMHRHLKAANDLAAAYQMIEAREVANVAYATLRHVAGDLDGALAAYSAAFGLLHRKGSLNAEGAHALAVFSIRLTQDRHGEYADIAWALHEEHGAIVADLLAVALSREGRLKEAAEIRARLAPIRKDFYYSLYLGLRALAVVQVGSREEAREIREQLLPLRDSMPGAASLSVSLRPVAHLLGDLAVHLGDLDEAAGHYRHAAEVARLRGAPLWVADAEKALAALSKP